MIIPSSICLPSANAVFPYRLLRILSLLLHVLACFLLVVLLICENLEGKNTASVSSNEAAHLHNYFQGIFWHFTAQVNLSKFCFFHQRVHILVKVVFPNLFIFCLNLAVDLGADLCGKGTGRPQCNDETI